MQRHIGIGEFFAHFAKNTLFLAKNSLPPFSWTTYKVWAYPPEWKFGQDLDFEF